MAKKKGRLLLVKIKAVGSQGAAQTICALQTKTLTVNNEEIDVTTAECENPGSPLWTEVLDGVRRLNLSGNGISKADNAEAVLTGIALADTPIAEMEVVVPNFGTFKANFFIQSLEMGGEQTAAVSFTLTAGSTGSVVFTPEAAPAPVGGA